MVEAIEEPEAVIPRGVFVGIGVGARFMNGWLLVVIQREQIVDQYSPVVVVLVFTVIAQHLYAPYTQRGEHTLHLPNVVKFDNDFAFFLVGKGFHRLIGVEERGGIIGISREWVRGHMVCEVHPTRLAHVPQRFCGSIWQKSAWWHFAFVMVLGDK